MKEGGQVEVRDRFEIIGGGSACPRGVRDNGREKAVEDSAGMAVGCENQSWR